METKTKIILGVLAVGTIAYLTRDKWMPKKSDSSEKKSDVQGVKEYSIKNKPKPCKTAANLLKGGSTIINPPCWSDRVGCVGC